MQSSKWHGVLSSTLGALAVTFVANMAINQTVIRPLVVNAVVFLALAVAVARWPKRWLYIVTGVLAVLVLVANVTFIREDLLHPETFTTFVPTMLIIFGALVAAVAAFAAAFRFAPAAAGPAGLASAALAIVLTVVSGAMTATAADDVMEQSDVLVVAENGLFPEHLEAEAGRVAFFVENRDRIRHTFVIVERGVKQEMPAVRNRRVVTQLEEGEYRFICDVPGHERMEGTLFVR
jgi:plastocyanin